jgi:hypothetical protein
MTDIVPYTNPATGWVALVQPAAELAASIANTDFVPATFRGKPAQIAACILYGAELGLGPMQALAKVDIVEGRAAPRAELARALVLGAGHDLWVEEATNTKVTVAGQRRGSTNVQRVTWTMDDAKKAGLDGRQNYRKYPRQMLLARASAELARMVAPDALGGVAYFAEELDGDIDAPVVSNGVGTEPEAGTQRRKAKATTARAGESLAAVPTVVDPGPPLPPLPGEDEAIVDAEVVDQADPEPRKPTAKQRAAVFALLAELGVSEDDRREYVAGVLALADPTGFSELSADQASELIDKLQTIADEQRTAGDAA